MQHDETETETETESAPFVEVARVGVVRDRDGIMAVVRFAGWLDVLDEVEGDELVVMCAQQLINEIDRDRDAPARPTRRTLRLVHDHEEKTDE